MLNAPPALSFSLGTIAHFLTHTPFCFLAGLPSNSSNAANQNPGHGTHDFPPHQSRAQSICLFAGTTQACVNKRVKYTHTLLEQTQELHNWEGIEVVETSSIVGYVITSILKVHNACKHRLPGSPSLTFGTI